MSLNKIEMDAGLLAALYGNLLVEDKPAARGATVTEFTWLGGREQPILLVVKQEEAVFLTDDDMTFLTRILNACKLTVQDVAIVNLFHYPNAQQSDLQAFFKPRIQLCFDITPQALQLPVDFPIHQLQAVGGCTYMHTRSLQQLDKDTEERKKCWASLKRLFNV